MHKSIYRLASLLATLSLAVGAYYTAGASPAQSFSALGKVFYVSTTGSDNNAGTSTAPFRTFAKAISVIGAGDTVTVLPGTYTQQLTINKSGTSSAPITVQGQGAVIDLQKTTSPAVTVSGSYVHASGFEVKNSNGICVNLSGDYVTASGLKVHECVNHGIQTHDNAHVKILNNTVYRAVLSNSARTLSSGWGSAIKVRLSDDVLIQGNTVYHNYGEGMGTRGTNITMRANTVFDNFSVNIYTNSENATIEKNFVYCTTNTEYYRDGKPAAGIAMGEEYFAGWGARLKNARVINNVVAYCKSGVRYNGAEAGVTGGGLKYATIAYNTLYGSVDSAIGIVYAEAQAGNLIADNIVWQAGNKLVSASGSGLTFENNLWKVLPPSIAQGPGDRIGSPSFVASNPGYMPNDYRPGSSSVALGGARDLSVTQDYFSNQRVSPFDMGGIQVSGGTSSATATPTAMSPATSTPIATSTATPQGTGTILDDQNSASAYSSGWSTVTSSSAYGGSFSRTSTNGAYTKLVFTGSSFSVIYKGGPSFRTMLVYIDGIKVGSINEYASVSSYKLRWDYPSQLTYGQHTLKLVFSTSSSSTNGSVDAVVIR